MPFRHLPLVLACAIGLGCPALHAASADGSGDLPPASAHIASAELPAARVKATLVDYRRWLDELDARHGAAGLATAVVVDDKVVFEHTLGYADAATKAPVTPTTVFRLASLSKAFATAVTGQLVDSGKLRWDMKLVDVLPYFKLKDMQSADQATVADILGQRLGLPHNTYDNLLEEDVPYRELVRKLDEVDNTCAAGQCYGYQNVAFSMIGDVLFARTGNFFDRLVDQRIFHPLDMQTASYGRSGLESSKSWARPHRPGRNHSWIPFEPNETYYRVAPAAGVNASIRDMEQWLIAQMGGRPEVLDPELLKVLHTPLVETDRERHASPWRRGRLNDAQYALGWRIYDYAGTTLVFHAGAVQGYRAMIAFLPRYRFGAVMLWNCESGLPAGLMPMLLDRYLGLPEVNWAGIDQGDTTESAGGVH
jgi:beta-lactamase class C